MPPVRSVVFRRRWVIALLALGGGLLLAAASVRAETTIERRLVEFTSGRWGAAEGEFGLRKAENGRSFGPRAFAVAFDGSLCVADTYNRRLVFFDGEGQPVACLPIDAPPAGGGGAFLAEDVACAPGGLVFVADASAPRLLVWKNAAPQGWSCQGWAPPVEAPEGTWALEGLWTAGKEVFFAQQVAADAAFYREFLAAPASELAGQAAGGGQVAGAGPWRRVTRLEIDAAGQIRCDSPALGAPGVLPARGRLYSLGPGRDRFERSLRGFSQAGAPLCGLDLEMPELVDAAELVGVDDGGRVYVGADLGGPRGRVLVWRSTKAARGGPAKVKDGAAAPPDDERARLPADLTLEVPGGEVLLRVHVRVTPQGDVYWASADGQGYAIRCWRTRRQWRLVPRFW